MKEKMNTREEHFVLQNYRHDRLNTIQALQKVRMLTGYRKIVPLWKRMAVAASLLALVAIGTMLYMANATTTIAAGNVTSIFMLNDGTRVTLSPYSSLTYKGRNCREVEIEGKAYLDIAHNAEQPFSIRDKNYVINDIGTKFMVEETTEGTMVYVTEGIVYFASTRKVEHGLTLHKNNGALLANNTDMPKAMTNTSANTASWATGTLHFDNTPLPQVLSDLTAHYGVKLECSDTTANLTGDFETGNLQEIIRIIENTLNVQISSIP